MLHRLDTRHVELRQRLRQKLCRYHPALRPSERQAQTSSITPILILLLSSSGTQHDQNMLATSSLQNHMVLESRAASRNVSPRFSRVGSSMRCPGAALLALMGTLLIIMAPFEADLYLVNALGLLPSWTRSMSPSA